MLIKSAFNKKSGQGNMETCLTCLHVMFTSLTCLMVFTGLTCLMVFYITQNGEKLKFGHIQEPTNNFELTH